MTSIFACSMALSTVLTVVAHSPGTILPMLLYSSNMITGGLITKTRLFIFVLVENVPMNDFVVYVADPGGRDLHE